MDNMAYVGHPYVRTVASNGDLYYTDEFYSAMYEKITRDGMTYVEAYNALGFNTAILTEARANAAGTRAVKMIQKKKLFEKNIADYDSDTPFDEMVRKCLAGEMTRDELYANMAARIIVLEEVNKELLKKTKSSNAAKK